MLSLRARPPDQIQLLGVRVEVLILQQVEAVVVPDRVGAQVVFLAAVTVVLLSTWEDHALRLGNDLEHLLHPSLLDQLLLLCGCLLLLLLCSLKSLHFCLLVPFLLDLLLLIRLAFLFISDPLLLFVDYLIFLWLLSRSFLVLAFVTCSYKLCGLGVTKGLFLEGEVLKDIFLGQLPLNHLLLGL